MVKKPSDPERTQRSSRIPTQATHPPRQTPPTQARRIKKKKKKRKTRKRRPDPISYLSKSFRYYAGKLHISELMKRGRFGRLIGFGGMFIGVLVIVSVIAFVLRVSIAGDALNPFSDEDVVALPTIDATANPEFLAPTLPPDNKLFGDNDRVTILLMGTDARASDAGYRTRTDTMMLLMLDTKDEHVGILSIPRDLYVDIPGQGLNRINTAYVYGGGILAVETIEYNLGIPIDYYVVVDFNVFVTLVDEIGGIDIYVPTGIADTAYPNNNYGYDPFYITAGQHHLDGETALKYARTRHADNDYERARRQQAVILAIRDRVLSLDMLPTLIQRAPSLYGTLSNGIRTDMTLEQITELALLAQDVPDEGIRSGVIDSRYVVGYYTPEGASVLIPNRAVVGDLLTHIFWLDQ